MWTKEAQEKGRANRKAMGNYVAWNKGLTRETDSRLAKIGDSRKGKNNPVYHNPNHSEVARQCALKSWTNGHPHARLRNTDIEIKMQSALKEMGLLHKTHQIFNKRWVADIVLANYPVVIECDGDYWHSTEKQLERDKQKDADIISSGYKVLRFKGSLIESDLARCVSEIEDIVRTY